MRNHEGGDTPFQVLAASSDFYLGHPASDFATQARDGGLVLGCVVVVGLADESQPLLVVTKDEVCSGPQKLDTKSQG